MSKRLIWRENLAFRLCAAIALASAVAGCAGSIPTIDGGKQSTELSAEQQRVYAEWKAARAAYDQELDRYWDDVERRREGRRAKRRSGQPFLASDYVTGQPPDYAGPKLPDDIARIVFKKQPDAPRDEIPALEEAIAGARTHFNFIPERVGEAEFKRRYAAEALTLGLTKAQVIRVYALETGGQGTYDMQAGINPITRQGTPISTALGYAQLLAANSIDELVQHGPRFEARLLALASARGTSAQRAAALRAKVAVLKRMRAFAMSVPNEWSAHTRLSQTAKGLSIHALNLDADIGPWMQVQKLASLAELAAKNGRPTLAGNEIELMNLAGPATGLEMMQPVALDKPTTNFFSRRGYYRNTIVRGKTSAQLLAALDQRMDVNQQKPGAVEFARIFDEVGRTRVAGQ